MGYLDTSGRYKRDPETGHMMDTQMHPKVLAAQELFAKTKSGRSKASPTDTNKIHTYIKGRDEK